METVGREIFTMSCSIDTFTEPLQGLIRKVRKAAADLYAEGDISRVEIYIEGTPGGKVETRVDGELITNSTLFDAMEAL